MHMAVEAGDGLSWKHAGIELEGLALSEHMAMSVSCGDLGWCFALTQSESWAGCWCGSWGPVVVCVCVVGFGKGLRQLASANANTCGTKPSEICRVFSVAVLAIGFFSDGSC